MTQAWPKGKMIEGRSGGSGRGTRRELWAPPDSGSSTSGSYVVSCTDARPSPPTHFPPPLPHPRTCLLATGKNSAAPERTFSSALVSAEWRAQRENDRREERGIWAGHSKRIVGPPGSGSSTSGSHVVSCTDARPSPPTHFLPSAASSPVAPACWPRGKIPPHPSARSARHWSPQDGGPKGKMIEGTSLFAKDYPAFLSTMPQGVSEHAAAFLPFTFSTSI